MRRAFFPSCGEPFAILLNFIQDIVLQKKGFSLLRAEYLADYIFYSKALVLIGCLRLWLAFLLLLVSFLMDLRLLNLYLSHVIACLALKSFNKNALFVNSHPQILFLLDYFFESLFHVLLLLLELYLSFYCFKLYFKIEGSFF